MMKKLSRGICLMLVLLMAALPVFAAAEGTDNPAENDGENPVAPTEAPTAAPTEAPTAAPTAAPTEAPTAAPTEAPTETPTAAPTAAPTETPTAAPTEAPTEAPTAAPTDGQTGAPTETPTAAPTDESTSAPTETPADPAAPTDSPVPAPTDSADPDSAESASPAPTDEPTAAPTEEPTATPAPDPEDLFEIRQYGILVGYRDREEEGQHERIVIPSGVRIIAAEAFMGDKVLKEVVIPDTVLEIQESAFEGCENLKIVSMNVSEEAKEKREKEKTIIRGRAFVDCDPELDRSFAKNFKTVAEDAFEILPLPTATPTPAPSAEPEDDEEWPDDDWWDDIDWGDDSPAPVTVTGRGRRTTHGKSTAKVTHDYAQVSLSLKPDQEPMHVLTLEGEELDLTLSGKEDQERMFTVALGEKENSPAAGPGEFRQGTVLLLCAVLPGGTAEIPGESLVWQLNGSVLLTLNKSGVDYLAFRYGSETVTVPTEGFLAGWAYDALKSRGTAGRRFDYTLTMNPEPGEGHWTVDVEGKHYDLAEDPLSAMYLDGVEQEGAERE